VRPLNNGWSIALGGVDIWGLPTIGGGPVSVEIFAGIGGAGSGWGGGGGGGGVGGTAGAGGFTLTLIGSPASGTDGTAAVPPGLITLPAGGGTSG